jgi:hypothetical protein
MLPEAAAQVANLKGREKRTRLGQWMCVSITSIKREKRSLLKTLQVYLG